MNSKISKPKDHGYTFAKIIFHSGFVLLMEIWKLRNSQLYLPAPEIKEATPEVMEEEAAPETKIVQHIESALEVDAAYEPQDCAMEEVATQIIVSEVSSSQPIPVALLKTIEEIKADNTRVNERLDKHDLMFQLILSRLPPPLSPPQNP